MSAITYKMDAQKDLVCNSSTTIYQNESGVDSINFLLPIKYNELELSDCIVAMEYLDPMNLTHVAILEKDEEIVSDQYYRYVFPITGDFTKMPGDITFVIEIVNGNQILRLGSSILTIEQWKDFMPYLPDENLTPMEKRVKIIEELAQ